MNRRVRHLKSSSYGALICLDARRLTLADGDAVSTWTDASGRGENATASSTARPTFKTGIQGGNPVVRFDGTNNKLDLSTTQFFNTGNTWSMFLVVKVDASAGSYPAIIATKTNVAQNWRFIASSVAGYSDFSFGTNSDPFGRYKFTAFGYGSWGLLSVAYDGVAIGQASSYTAQVAGAARSTGAAGAFGGDSSANGAVGAETGGANKFKGDLGFVAITSSIVASAMRKRITQSLAFTWKLSCS